MKVILPKDGPKKAYYEAYVGYVLSILKENDIHPLFDGSAVFNLFKMKIDNRPIIIDFSDFYNINLKYYSSEEPYFKFHYCKEKHQNFKNIHSFTGISFYDWVEFFKLRESIKYSCNNDLVIHMQRPRGAAVERRNFVRSLLVEKYGDKCRYDFVENQNEFWKTINNCLVHICVPGARNDILDRGQLQVMALGCCTISPVLSDCLAWNKELLPGVHYISCLPDYSDLIEKIEWCKSNRNLCVEIGNNAKKLFDETSTPQKLLEWIIRAIK